MFAKQWIAVARSSLFLIGIVASTGDCCSASDVKVIFDIPSKVECCDITPEKCAKAHPNLKLIEARFRISAGVVDGDESAIEDFVYMIASPDLRMKVLDFLPNTTLESTAAGDRIEVTDRTENSDVVSGEARVSYALISLNASKTSSNKKSEVNQYQRVAPKTLVLASGTVNRGSGVFYKLKPSAGISLEGEKEFVLMCVVPKTWQGDWCTVTCSARARRKSTISSKTVASGIEQAHVGLYLKGNQSASELADELTHLQLANDGLLSRFLAQEAMHSIESLHATSSIQMIKFPGNDWLKRVSKSKPSPKEAQLEAAKGNLLEVEDRLKDLSGHSESSH